MNDFVKRLQRARDAAMLETGERQKVEQGRCWSWTERRNAGKKPFRVKQ